MTSGEGDGEGVGVATVVVEPDVVVVVVVVTVERLSGDPIHLLTMTLMVPSCDSEDNALETFDFNVVLDDATPAPISRGFSNEQ